MKNKTILSEYGLNEFNIGIKEIYEKAYEISGSQLSNSCFLHRICWNVLFKYSYQIKGSYICLVADDNEINRAHIVYPLGKFSNQELKDIVNYWRMIFGKYNKHLRIEFIDEVGLSRLRTCLDEEGILWHQKIVKSAMITHIEYPITLIYKAKRIGVNDIFGIIILIIRIFID